MLISDLNQKNSAKISKEVESIINNVGSNDDKSVSNKALAQKVEVIDKKFEKLTLENKELKKMIQNKNSQFNKMNLAMDHFKKELASIKQHKFGVLKENIHTSALLHNNIKTLSKNKNLFNKNNKVNNKEVEAHKLGIKYSYLDTMELMRRLSIDDPTTILHMPRKVVSKAKGESPLISVPKLDMHVTFYLTM